MDLRTVKRIVKSVHVIANDNLKHKLNIFLTHQLSNNINSVHIDPGTVKTNIKSIINK